MYKHVLRILYKQKVIMLNDVYFDDKFQAF